jgi:hypothetical protein
MEGKLSHIEFISVANSSKNPVFGFIQKKIVSREEFFAHHKEKTYSDYWNKFHFRLLIEYNQPQTVISEIFETFQKLKDIDSRKFHEFHKGNPYYYLGISYFMIQDYESAVYYINAAAKEDLELKPKPNYPSPATWFIEMDSKPEKQAGREIVRIAETEMNRLIAEYNKVLVESSIKEIFSIEKLRDKLLKKATAVDKQQYQTIATSIISYVLEFSNRIQSLRILDSLESVEPFVLHLFKGCIILESILKENPRPNAKIKSSDDLISWVKNKSKDLNLLAALNLNAKNLQSIIIDLPSRQLNLEDCFSITCKVRNKTGHTLEWEFKTTERQYQLLFDAIGVSCLHTINRLY